LSSILHVPFIKDWELWFSFSSVWNIHTSSSITGYEHMELSLRNKNAVYKD
jgi:hypothetical protein